jgi:hypothetical protein
MHRFSSVSILLRFRIAALLLFCMWVLIPATLVILAYSILIVDESLTVAALWLGLLVLLLAMVQRLLASRARCPLCMTPVLTPKRCSKHRNARKFLGSFRLRVAMGVLFKGSFACPYCHERSAMQVRERRC